jgi:transcriptional regulator with XRE-family HTH domain
MDGSDLRDIREMSGLSVNDFAKRVGLFAKDLEEMEDFQRVIPADLEKKAFAACEIAMREQGTGLTTQ